MFCAASSVFFLVEVSRKMICIQCSCFSPCYSLFCFKCSPKFLTIAWPNQLKFFPAFAYVKVLYERSLGAGTLHLVNNAHTKRIPLPSLPFKMTSAYVLEPSSALELTSQVVVRGKPYHMEASSLASHQIDTTILATTFAKASVFLHAFTQYFYVSNL